MWASGSEVKKGNGDHQKGLFEKAEKGHIDVIRLLLKYGAQPDMRDRDGITAIMYACFHGHSGAVKAFLNEGANADFRYVNIYLCVFMYMYMYVYMFTYRHKCFYAYICKGIWRVELPCN